MATDPEKTPVNPTAMSLHDAARLLTSVEGEPISEGLLQTDIEAGAPTNPDGTLNLVHYAAWLVRQMAGKSDGH